jgi:uncharacterized protein involved in exopolysaccharide biosynthesis
VFLEPLLDTRIESSVNSEYESGFGDVIAVVWRRRWFVLVLTIIGTTAGALAAMLVSPKYAASVLISPVSDRTSHSGLDAALGSAVSHLGGVSALAGLSLSGSDIVKAEAVATLQSAALTERYIRDGNLLPVLFSNKWDGELQRWNVPNPKLVPTLWKGNQYFGKLRKVEQNAKTGLVTVTITWRDPVVAAQWANDLVRLTNEYMQDKAIQETERNIDYLNEQAAKTNVFELRRAIFDLMESEVKQEMMARGTVEYALKVVDPAIPPENKSSPQPLLWTFAGCALGFVLGVIAAVARHAAVRAEAVSQRSV